MIKSRFLEKILNPMYNTLYIMICEKNKIMSQNCKVTNLQIDIKND